MTIKGFNSRCHFVLNEFFDSDIAHQRHIDLSVDAFFNKNYDVLENISILVSEILEPARRLLGMPIIITSGYRNNVVNHLCGGSSNSLHLKGCAADVTCSDLKRLYNILSNSIASEVIYHPERNYIHVGYERK